MTRQLPFRQRDDGFFFPYVVVISVILFMFLTTNIFLYNNEQKITSNLVEQIKIDTLVQSAKNQFLQEKVYESHSVGEVLYVFPDGEVKVTFQFEGEDQLDMEFKVILSRNRHYFYTQKIRINEERLIFRN